MALTMFNPAMAGRTRANVLSRIHGLATQNRELARQLEMERKASLREAKLMERIEALLNTRTGYETYNG